MATLKQQLLDDLNQVFQAGLETVATHTNSATVETINVLFDRVHEMTFENGLEVSTQQPQILVQTADAGNVDRDSVFVIESVTYYVLEIQPDEHGTQRILLSRNQAG